MGWGVQGSRRAVVTDDGLEAIGERDAGVVDRRVGLERNAGRETKNNLDSIQ